MLILSASIPVITVLGIYLLFENADIMPAPFIMLLGLGAVFGVGASIFGMLKALFRRPDFIPAVPLAPSHERKFRQFISSLCREMYTRKPKIILLSGEPGFFVAQGRIRGLFGTYRGRILCIGVPSLSLLTCDELRSILAHEFAHFTGGETLYSAHALPIYEGTCIAAEGMSGLIKSEMRGAAWLSIPLYLPWMLLSFLVKTFSAVYSSITRKREIRADVIAARLCGSGCFSRALKKVSSVGALFRAVSGWHIVSKLRKGEQFGNYYEFFRQIVAESPGLLAEFEERVLRRPESESGVHPSLQVRLALMAEMPDVQGKDGTPASSLFPCLETYEEQLTEFKTLMTRALVASVGSRRAAKAPRSSPITSVSQTST